MGQIHIDLFTPLDLVGQAPGDPYEDADSFPFGGWQAPLFDDVVAQEAAGGLASMDALLLGRRTYDIFAGFWPQQEGGVDGAIATMLNSLPKYVASRGTPQLDWSGSQLLGPDLVSAVREAQERHDEVHVIGSLNLTQTLLRERLFDRLNLWVFPIVLGVRKKIFQDGAMPFDLTLAAPPVASTKGAVMLKYALADGEAGAGDMRTEVRGA